MGVWTSYYKKCNTSISWFIEIKNGYTNCKKCGEKNTEKDLILSMRDIKYWKKQNLKKRILKIKKIKKYEKGRIKKLFE